MAVALADSLKVRTAMELEQAMLERAIAMSLGLEASAVAGEASTAAPAPEPTSPTAAPSAPLPPGSKPAAPESKALGEHDTEGVGTPAKQGGDRGRPQDKITEPPTPLRAVPETPDGRVAARREEPASPGPSAAAAVASSQPAAPEPQSLRGFVPGAVPMVASTPPKLVPLKSIRSGTGYRGAGFNSSESSAALDPVKLKARRHAACQHASHRGGFAGKPQRRWLTPRVCSNVDAVPSGLRGGAAGVDEEPGERGGRLGAGAAG